MRYSTRREQRGQARWNVDFEMYERAVNGLTGYLCLLHARGDWSDAPVYVARHRNPSKPPRRSHLLRCGYGEETKPTLNRKERNLFGGLRRWENAHRQVWNSAD